MISGSVEFVTDLQEGRGVRRTGADLDWLEPKGTKEGRKTSFLRQFSPLIAASNFLGRLLPFIEVVLCGDLSFPPEPGARRLQCLCVEPRGSASKGVEIPACIDVRRGALRASAVQDLYANRSAHRTGLVRRGAPSGWRGVQTRVAARLARVGRGRGSIPRLELDVQDDSSVKRVDVQGAKARDKGEGQTLLLLCCSP
jgi:hypothetical protein